MPHPELVESRADTHMIWFGVDYPLIAARIGAFPTTDRHAGRSDAGA
jgi:hypothetical protein